MEYTTVRQCVYKYSLLLLDVVICNCICDKMCAVCVCVFEIERKRGTEWEATMTLKHTHHFTQFWHSASISYYCVRFLTSVNLPSFAVSIIFCFCLVFGGYYGWWYLCSDKPVYKVLTCDLNDRMFRDLCTSCTG